jgi:hypothetical protein
MAFMGEFNKDPNQSGSDKQAQGDKPAFGQFDKGQQGEQAFGQEKGQETGQDKQQFGQEKGQETGQDKQQFGQEKGQETGQQYAEEKTPSYGQDKQSETTGSQGGQQQDAGKTERQQGDEDLDEDSKSTTDNQGMK